MAESLAAFRATAYGIRCIVFAQFSQYFGIRGRSQLHWGGHGFSVGALPSDIRTLTIRPFFSESGI
jgi:hypothetical protein